MADSYYTRMFQSSFLGTDTDDSSVLDPEIETYEDLGNRMAHQVERHQIWQTSLLARILTLPEENICDISFWQTSTYGSLWNTHLQGAWAAMLFVNCRLAH
jgi:hypothetical protein